jgi:hypothetical protein
MLQESNLLTEVSSLSFGYHENLSSNKEFLHLNQLVLSFSLLFSRILAFINGEGCTRTFGNAERVVTSQTLHRLAT